MYNYNYFIFRYQMKRGILVLGQGGTHVNKILKNQKYQKKYQTALLHYRHPEPENLTER